MARPGPGTGQNPVSFKTVPGRHRTQKWNTAKTYNYSGDDWGGYDPYDEYGGYDEEPPPSAMPPQQQQQYSTQQQQQQQRPGRHQSFDDGDERRAFSGPGAFPVSGRGSPAVSSTSGGRTSNDYQPRPPSRPRDFTNPDYVPPPLNTTLNMRPSPANSASGFIPPPRKNSISNASPQEKELPTPPVIRPSDIYKRVPAERKKERKMSLESSSRPSFGSESQHRPSLGKVEEANTSPLLPPVKTFSGFGSDLFPSGSFASPETRAPAGGDPAADILAERTATRAPPGHDPAADILAERTHTRALPGNDPAADILNERSTSTQPTRSPSGADPAADILNERTHMRALPGNDPAEEIMNERTFTPGAEDTQTRAPPGADPAADILAERTHTRAPPGADPAADILNERTLSRAPPGAEGPQTRALPSADPAADILAERTPARAQPGADPAADILNERTHTRAPPGVDPAAEILNDRTHSVPTTDIGRQPDTLSHQPSQGYRSVVNKAFDRPDDTTNSIPATPISRDNSRSTNDVDVSRSNTNSTSGISPIMSRVPSAATAKMQQQAQVEQAVPTIAEEPRRQASSDSYGFAPSASPPAAAVQPGYRRSLDPPSGDNSPARTPGMETTSNRRFSEGLAAETVSDEPIKTGRARAGTDYSIREADYAQNVDKRAEPFDVMAAAEREHESRELFLQTHDSPSNPASPASGRSSPAKSRVRQIADQYQEIQRRNSEQSGQALSAKSSWSRFGGSEENLSSRGVKRQETGQSNTSDYNGVEEGGVRDSPTVTRDDERPGLDTQPSFRPHLPGEWVSTSNVLNMREESPAPPARSEEPTAAQSQLTPTSSRQTEDEGPIDLTPTTRKRAPTATRDERTVAQSQHDPLPSRQIEDEGPIDLTPTTRKHALSGSHHNNNDTTSTSPSYAQDQSLWGNAKTAGEGLGAALLAKVGIGHQTRDFGSAEPAKEVEVPVDRTKTGEMFYQRGPERPPWLARGDTDASVASTMTAGSDWSGSVATPPASQAQPHAPAEDNRAGNYFAAPAPLRTGRSREPTPEATTSSSGGLSSLPSHMFGPASSASSSSGLQRDDSMLRREIVQSLQPRDEEVERMQDALDAPENQRRVAEGETARPAHEISRPLLDQRFSWEKEQEQEATESPSHPTTANAANVEVQAPVPRVREPEPDSSPEIRPEMPYERPRSRGLHIMNAEGGDSSEDEQERPQTSRLRDSTAAERGLEVGLPVGAAGLAAAGGMGWVAASSSQQDRGPVSPMMKSQEDMRADEGVGAERGDLGVPSPDSTRLPSYYMQDSAGLEPARGSRSEDGDDTLTSVAPEALDEKEATATPARSSLDAPPPPPEKEVHAPSPTSPTSSKHKVPPFREILAIKSPDARIRTYDDTRRTFADMNTGLSDWLSGMLAQNPQYSDLSTTAARPPPPALQSSGTFGRVGGGHKVSPSLSKFTKPFVGGSASEPSASSSGAAGAGGGAAERGKELMKGAGVLGGKAQAGAKGLFAKGRSRFGTQRESKGGRGIGGDGKPVSSPSLLQRAPSRSQSQTPVNTKSNSPAPLQRAPSGSQTRTPSSPPTQSVNAESGSPAPLHRAPSRSQTRTPSSLSRISRTFSRLREQSRSRSLSSGRGASKSRPASLVLSGTPNQDSGNLEQLEPIEYAPRERNAGDGSAEAVAPWDEPGAPGVQQRNVTAPARLGVLPSPAVDTFSTKTASRPQTAIAASGGGNYFAGSPTDRLGRERTNSGIAATLDSQYGVASPAVERFSLLTESRPQTPSSSRTPIVDDSKAGEDEEKELYESTPVADKFRAGEEEEKMYESTPVASNNPSPMTARHSLEHGWYDTTPVTIRHASGVSNRTVIMQPVANSSDGEVQVAAGAPRDSPAREIDVKEDLTRTGEKASPHLSPNAKQGTAFDIANEPTAHDHDKRSVISADDDIEGVRNEVEPTVRNHTPSRRSSVSSFGQFSPYDAEKPIMSAQAVPAGPITSAVHRPSIDEVATPQQHVDTQPRSAQHDHFMNRGYRTRDDEAERFASYVPLGRNGSGGLAQESIDISKPSTASVDLSGYSGPPPGAAPFQQHPASRGLENADMRPNRFSEPPKVGRRPSMESAAQGPRPSQINNHYGLQGLQTDAANVARPKPAREPEPLEDKQSRRRSSGLWDAIRRSRSVSRTTLRKEPSSGRLQSQQNLDKAPVAMPVDRVRNHEPHSSNPKTPQRSATTNAEPERKKRLFSGLASLFGRSNTTGRKAEKPRTLVKAQPRSREVSHAKEPATTGGYDAYEARRRQQIPDLQPKKQRTSPAASAITSHQQPTAAPVSSGHGWQDPPTGGWYGPADQVVPQGSMAQEEVSSQHRRFHSEGFGQGALYSGGPAAFQPAESSYAGPAAARSPPIQRHIPSMYASPTSPVWANLPIRQTSQPQQHLQYRSSSADAYQQRQSSYPLTDNQLSPQISGQSEWQRSGWRARGSMPSISPVQTNTGSDSLPAGHNYRIGSISEEVARSPARAYGDQQTPWAVDMPRRGGRPRDSSQGSSWAMPNVERPTYVEDVVPMRGFPMDNADPTLYRLPMSPQTPGSSIPTRYPDDAPSSLTAHAPTNPQSWHYDRRFGDNPYPSSPYVNQSPSYSQRSPNYARPLQQAKGRYYEQPASEQEPPPGQAGAGYSMQAFDYSNMPSIDGRHQWSSSYAGRRDDSAVGEERVEMRAVSYPGQEWVPERWDSRDS
ncbi:hypothetical protein LTR37_012228 [Vermiconidia calcicola]|uniref:Uncharacterized protein n=1 Tax=Vermiconidia calcicola TaxID=1690605 RepID=A0ACC3N197_9PEZI|nr:hypothetical protein LTR37_012228 [Vermiconidia calcicola]